MDPLTLLRFGLALVLVIGLIMLVAVALRRWGGKMPGVIARRQRLSTVETLSLDPRRRLVLVRRDGVEHLLLTGGGNDLVVETGIVPPAAPPAEAEPGAGGGTLVADRLERFSSPVEGGDHEGRREPVLGPLSGDEP